MSPKVNHDVVPGTKLGSKYQIFDRSRLKIKPIHERENDLHIDRWMDLEDEAPSFDHDDLSIVAKKLHLAKAKGRARVLIMGAHVLRAGVNNHVIDLMEQGFIDHIAMNGAGAIHDYELARIGATTESVEKYIQSGEFGLWSETGELNDWVTEAQKLSLGMGENLGRQIYRSAFPYRRLSILAAAYHLSIPATIHVGIGYDIVHEHPNCDGAAYGAASYRDFLIFANTLERLEGGVMLTFGSAIMAPEVFLKALAMVRNVAHQHNKKVKNFTTAVFDIWPIRGDFRKEVDKADPGYYFRPHKTILVRTVADGGESYYFQGEHRATLPALRQTLLDS